MQRRESSVKKIDKYIFNLDDHLGSGTFGKVYKGKALDSSLIVAIKVIDLKVTSENKNLLKSLENEVELMKKLDSPYVVRLYDTYYTKNHFYLVTEYCNQGDLRNFFLQSKKAFSEKQARSILKDIIKGLEELSKHKIIHRDLKPENILIHNNNFKIGDFGLSKSVENFQNQILSSCVGSPLYMSPQVIKMEHYTSKCDIWSLGLIYYEMLFGKTPWPATNVNDLIRRTSKEPLRFPYQIFLNEMSKEFLRNCLKIDEASRFSLENVLNDQVYLKRTDKLSIFELDMQKKVILDEKSKEIIMKLQKAIQNLNLTVEKLYGSISPSHNSKGELQYSDFEGLISMIDKECSNETIVYLFQKIDQDDSKTISYDEFQFLFFDTDFNEYVVFKDPFLEEKKENILISLKAILEKTGKSLKEIMKIYNSSIKMNNIDFLNFLRTIDTNISTRDCEYIFNSIDTDKNGTIDLEEFEKALEALNLDKVLKRKEDILEQEKFKKKSLDIKKEKNEPLSKEAKIYIKFLSDMMISQHLNYDELIKNFDSKNKFALNWDDFKRMMQLVVEKNEIKVIKEIWDIFKNKSSAEMGIKDIKRMIQNE